MRVLIVHAHHEPSSFNGAMTRAAVETLSAAGHAVVVSDLYAMGFDPVSDRRNFTGIADAQRLRQQDEEALASQTSGYAPDVLVEIEKLDWCDLLIFQFPIWWLGLPAIMKGWVDRVMVLGHSYGGGHWFSDGMHKGKRAICALTVGGREDVYAEGALYAPVEQILYPVHYGIFGFTGFTVLEPFVVYGPNRMEEGERAVVLDAWRNRLVALDRSRVLVNGP